MIKGLFKNVTIHGSVHTIVNRIKTSIPFLIYSIAKENTFNSPRFEFGSIVFRKMNKNNTSKNARW